MARFENTATRVFAAPRELVWAIVADSNRMNRALGNVPGRYAWRHIDGVRQYVATGRDLGQTIEWIEPPYQWVEGEFIDTERHFIRGPVQRGWFGVRLRSVEAGTECELRMGFSGKGVLLAALGPIASMRHRSLLRRALDAVGEALTAGDALSGDPAEPAAVRVRRMLTAGYNQVTSGDRTPSDALALGTALERLGREPIAAELGKRLGDWLRDRPDEEVAQMRPFEIARAWNIDRREALRAFLYGTRAGLVDLRWQVNCPTCRVSAQVTGTLADVGTQVHCAACNLSYDVDFGRYVEAVFQANPQIRRVTPQVFCAASPSWRPHVFGQMTIAPGASRTLPVDVPIGEMHLRTLSALTPANAIIAERPAKITVDLDDDRIDLRVEGQSSDGRTQLVVSSRAEAEQVLLLERSGWEADQVLGSVVASFPEFLDLFATEAPATGVELSVGHLTVLFSDLTGSTALYQRIGDAKAFALVEAHFTIMEKSIVGSDGALIKTMGDAVMATFYAPADGVRAAIGMVRANDREQGHLGLGVKLGLHTGACLAVRANDRLDFFGTTVNLSARLQAQAHAGELVLTEELAKDPSIAPLIAQLPARTFEAHLKGISAPQKLIAFDCSERANTTA